MSVMLRETEITANIFSGPFLYCINSGLILLGKIYSAIFHTMQYAIPQRGHVVDFIDSVFTLL